MNSSVIDPLRRLISLARRRLAIQQFTTLLSVKVVVCLAGAIACIVLEPVLRFSPTVTTTAWIVGILSAVVVSSSVFFAWRSTPSHAETAVLIDQRYSLQERITTAISLSPEIHESGVGKAIVEDAELTIRGLSISEHFPIRFPRVARWIPLQVGLLLLLIQFYDPNMVSRVFQSNDLVKKESISKELASNQTVQPPRPVIRPPLERANQFRDSKELQELRSELEKLYAENKSDRSNPSSEKVREKVAEIGKTEETLKKQQQKLAEQFQQLQQQLERFGTLEDRKSENEGPTKELAEALAKGDLKKAQEEADRLRKKAREKKLDEKEAQKLQQDLKDMENRLDRLSREQRQKEQKLNDLIEQAKKEKRDADSLERELNNLQQEMAQSKESQKLSESIQQAKKALEQKDFDGLADQMEKLSTQLGDLQDQLKDLEDIDEHLQNLKEMKKQLCEKCEGPAKTANGQRGKPGHKDDATGFAEGATGRRDENPKAKTQKGEDTQVRGFFDATGKKRYGGSTTGPAFKQRTTAEMEGEIQRAVQEAPEAIEVQRLPRAAKEMIKEYFEKFGGTSPSK